MGKSKLILWARKHSPEIFTGIGIAGIFITAALTTKATVKAVKLVDAEKHPEPDLECELTKKDIVKTAWKCYIPATGSAILTTACFLAAHRVQHRRLTALATAYSLSEATFRDYQKKVVEKIGEKKEKEVQDEVAKEHLDKRKTKDIIETGKGTTLCYDVLTDRLFYHDIEKIRKAVNELNRRMRDEMYISLNEFYYAIGLHPVSACIGDELGWNIDHGYIDIKLSSQLTDDDRPCLVLDYLVEPCASYRRLY